MEKGQLLNLKPIGHFAKDNSPSAFLRKMKMRWYLDTIFEKAIFLAGILFCCYGLYKLGYWLVIR
jgi:hypothetical protein|tara:strand:- start:10147 stop:10341 length:195 start_codon:yes stop_codon:yes gene_type:complete